VPISFELLLARNRAGDRGCFLGVGWAGSGVRMYILLPVTRAGGWKLVNETMSRPTLVSFNDCVIRSRIVEQQMLEPTNPHEHFSDLSPDQLHCADRRATSADHAGSTGELAAGRSHQDDSDPAPRHLSQDGAGKGPRSRPLDRRMAGGGGGRGSSS